MGANKLSWIDRLKNMSKEEIDNLSNITQIHEEPLTEREKNAVDWACYKIAYDIAERDVLRHGLEYAKKELEFYKSVEYTEKGFLDGYEDNLGMREEGWWKID